MTETFRLDVENLEGTFDDPTEQATFSRITIAIGQRIVTRCASASMGLREYVKLPLVSLATGLANHWWPLLYEPRRPQTISLNRVVRHRLDAYTRGFVFPPLEIWSAGREAVAIGRPSVSHVEGLPDRVVAAAKGVENQNRIDRATLSRITFVDESLFRATAGRGEVENQLFDLVTRVIERCESSGNTARELREQWQRVLEAIDDPEVHAYCVAAGRLGLDPYNEDAPDIGRFADQLPSDSFEDLCEAAPLEELEEATAWVADAQRALRGAPVLDVGAFGAKPILDPNRPAWESGYEAAVTLRQRLGLRAEPSSVSEIVQAQSAFSIEAPPAAEGVVLREVSGLRSLVVSRSPQQWRFRAARALFLGWGSEPGQWPLVTSASTHRQRASRAFAAELLCPAAHLHARAGQRGLTEDMLSEIAEEFGCPATVVQRQAENHGVPLRGLP